MQEVVKVGKVMELKDTVELMLSDKYEDRFKAEYYQLKIRKSQLEKILEKYQEGKLGFNSVCPYDDLLKQFLAMELYQKSLEKRAELENIKL